MPIPQMSHNRGKLPDVGYKPTPEATAIGKNPSHTVGLREQQFTKRKGREKECWINTTATTSHNTYKGPRRGKVCMASRFCGHIMEMTSVSSLRKKKEKQLENQKQQNLFQGLNMKQTHVKHDFKPRMGCKKKRLSLTLVFETANILL